MIIDYIEALGVLDHAGIRVVRAKYVDSAEDAVAFATRREARDPRAIPIALSVHPRATTMPPFRTTTEDALRSSPAIYSAYERLATPAVTLGYRIVAHDSIAGGTDVRIACRTEDAVKYLALRSGENGLERPVPVEDSGARELVEHMLAHDHRGPSEKNRRMLEHLVARVSKLFEELEIDTLELDPIRLHENTYTVLAASIAGNSRLHVDKRLAHHARDRKGYGYRPAGRQ